MPRRPSRSLWNGARRQPGGVPVSAPTRSSSSGGGGQTLRLDIFMSHDVAAGFEYHSFSLNFDTDLENELNLGPMAQVEWGGSDVDPGPGQSSYYVPLSTGVTTLESTGANAGRINSYEQRHAGGRTPGNRRRVQRRNHHGDGARPVSRGAGVLHRERRAAMTVRTSSLARSTSRRPRLVRRWQRASRSRDGTVIYGNATINLVPEPGTVSLLGLGLIGLVVAGRRARRS